MRLLAVAATGYCFNNNNNFFFEYVPIFFQPVAGTLSLIKWVCLDYRHGKRVH